jgi:hypothetical protein
MRGAISRGADSVLRRHRQDEDKGGGNYAAKRLDVAALFAGNAYDPDEKAIEHTPGL